MSESAGDRSLDQTGRGSDPVSLSDYVTSSGLPFDDFSKRQYQHDNGPVPRPQVSFCDGPDIVETSQTYQFRKRYMFFVTSEGIKYKEFTPPATAPAGGTLAGLYDSDATGYSKIYGCFDVSAFPAIAIQKTSTLIEVSRYNGGTPTAYGDFSGLSPLLFEIGIIDTGSGNNDLVLFYIDSDGEDLYARFQRDNFATEYTINSSLEPLASLDAIDGIGQYVVIWATSKEGKIVTLRSQLYAPAPVLIEDSLSFTPTFLSGAHTSVSVDGGTHADALTLDVGMESGLYFPVILIEGPFTDSISISGAFESGSYDATILEEGPFTDAATLLIAFQSGDYTEVVVGGGTHTEALTLDIGFQSGNYATP